VRVRLNYFDTGYGRKQQPKRRQKKRRPPAAPVVAPPAPASKPRRAPAAAAPAAARAASAPPRLAVPSALFDALRDKGGWPDHAKAWISYQGERWWPVSTMEHSLTVLRGTKDFQAAFAAGEVVEFVRAGGPLDQGRA
jgi:hypothetical protein